MGGARGTRLFAAVFLAFLALHVSLVATQRLYPFTDIPNHLAAATIHRFYSDPANAFQEYYALDTYLQPNVFHLFFCSSRIFPSVETANRVYLSIYTLLLPLAALIVIRKLGGNPWFSLLSFLLLYNSNVSWGFVGFAFAVPLILLFYNYAVLGAAERDRTSTVAFSALLLAVLFFVHLVAALFCALLLLVAAIAAARREGARAFGRLAIAAPLVIVLGAWFLAGEGGAPGVARYLVDFYRHDYLVSLPHRGKLLILDNRHLFADAKGLCAALVFSLSIIVPALAPLGARRGALPDEEENGRKAGMHGAAAPWTGLRGALPLLAAALIAYFALPSGIPNQTILFERFSVVALLAAIFVGSVAARRARWWLVAPFVIILCTIHLWLYRGYFDEFRRESAPFTTAVLPDETGSKTLAGLIVDYRYRGRPVYIHFPSYYIVWKRGIATTTISDYRFSAVRRRAPESTLPRYLEWVGRFNNYDGRYAGVDFILARGDLTPGISERLESFMLVKQVGRWSLYERWPSHNRWEPSDAIAAIGPP